MPNEPILLGRIPDLTHRLLADCPQDRRSRRPLRDGAPRLRYDQGFPRLRYQQAPRAPSIRQLMVYPVVSSGRNDRGEGPLVLLLHGWPETWYSWRHQIDALAAAGYRVVAPDQRGYGATDRPDAVDQYSIFHLVGDVVALIHELGEEQAAVVGHDWGSIVASNTAVLRPNVVRGLACVAIPPIPRGPLPPMTETEQRFGKGFYQNYFQEPGVAEAGLEKDVAATFRLAFSGVRNPEPSEGFLGLFCSSNQRRCRTGSLRKTWRRSSSSSPQAASPAV